MVHYPEASDDFRYSLHDLNLLISEHQHLGIASTKDLSNYHLHFMAITSWLIKKQQLSDLKQRRAYIQVFRPQLLSAIISWLRLNNLDHHPNIPYQVPDVYAAARYILQGNTMLGYTSTATSIPSPSKDILTVEDLAPFMSDVTKSIVDALRGPDTSSHHRKPNRLVAPTPVPTVDYLYEDIDDVSERKAAIKAEIASLDALENASTPPTVAISISQPTVPEHPYRHAQSITEVPSIDLFITESNYSHVNNSIDEASSYTDYNQYFPKGVPARESRTGRRLVSPAKGGKKKF